ncbi:MAG TPA: helix-turn-helix transcriptional regulator [Pseudonocardiaceae bacterium]|nr:helix-turn-helix transcriptional regulator [Pseudonocardiaceae bacterium]
MARKRRWGRLSDVAEQDPGPVVQRIVLGAELKALRDAAKIGTEEVASTLSWYRAKVSKVETGTVRVTAAELSELLRLYKADDATSERVQRLGEEARRKTSPARVPDWASKYLSLEASATEIKLFFGDFVPGMLQTRDYARALLSTSVIVPPADVEQMAVSRELRAERLRGGAPLLWVVLGEEALRRTVGGRQVQRGQLIRLRELAKLPNVTIQVMPLSGGAHPALGMSFNLLDLGLSRTVYIEGLTSADWLVRQHIPAYSLAFDRLRVASLGDRESLAIINTIIDELEE